jgi:hypothetical protein
VLFRLCLILSLPLLLPAEDHWVALKSGPFEVLSDAGDRPAREKLMYLEQFREALRVVTGKKEMRLVWPVRVLVFKRASQIPAGADAAPFALGRDARMAAVTEKQAFSPESLKALARILLYENTNRLPQPVEDGLVELFSTLQVNGTQITLGAPVPEAERSRGWAQMHLLTVSPNYSGRTQVMISNLEQSADFEAACRNAFEKSAKQINEETDAYLKADNFQTTSVSGRALSMTRDFEPVSLESGDAKIAVADLLLAGGSLEAKAAYGTAGGAESAEGLGLIALKEHKDNDAQQEFQAAVDSGSKSARAWLELGRLEGDPAKARADLKKAGELNPDWAEPYYRLAELEKDNPAQRAAMLKKAASLDVRNIDYWEALARTETAAQNFAEAQKAWAGAERAAANDEERGRIHQMRLQVDQERFDAEVAERKRQEEERERDIARVKAQSDAAIHAAETEARKEMNPNGEQPPKPVTWMDVTPKAGASIEGRLERLDCMGTEGRLVIETDDGKTVQLLVGDPSQITVGGGGERSLACGAQRPARRVVVQYTAKQDSKRHTIGQVTLIEFH